MTETGKKSRRKPDSVSLFSPPEIPPVAFDGDVLFVEPFYAGSHKQLVNVLTEAIPNSRVIKLTAKKWHWRARCSALTLSMTIPEAVKPSTLFCSSVLSLAELLGLRPDLHAFKKVVYFHENQLNYPVRVIKDRDVQFAYNQITTCLCADVIIFNSAYNMNSFLDKVPQCLKLIPEQTRKESIVQLIKSKSSVLYFPIIIPRGVETKSKPEILHIAWPHRWEFDKGPEEFFNVLFRLKEEKVPFLLSVMGETFNDVPDIFHEAQETLSDEIINWGFCEDRMLYLQILTTCHVVVSTAKHEFYGVSVLESVFSGCYPLVPNRLVYPEIYPEECLFNTNQQLYKMLKNFCKNPEHLVNLRDNLKFNIDRFSADELLPKFKELLL